MHYHIITIVFAPRKLYIPLSTNTLIDACDPNNIPLSTNTLIDACDPNNIPLSTNTLIDACDPNHTYLFLSSLDYLRQVAGPRTVPVELGSRYTDEEWSQKLMTVSEFIDNCILCQEVW